MTPVFAILATDLPIIEKIAAANVIVEPKARENALLSLFSELTPKQLNKHYSMLGHTGTNTILMLLLQTNSDIGALANKIKEASLTPDRSNIKSVAHTKHAKLIDLYLTLEPTLISNLLIYTFVRNDTASLAVLEVLLKHGLAPNIPLHHAVKSGSHKAVSLLLKYGANPAHQGPEEMSAFRWAHTLASPCSHHYIRPEQRETLHAFLRHESMNCTPLEYQERAIAYIANQPSQKSFLRASHRAATVLAQAPAVKNRTRALGLQGLCIKTLLEHPEAVQTGEQLPLTLLADIPSSEAKRKLTPSKKHAGMR